MDVRYLRGSVGLSAGRDSKVYLGDEDGDVIVLRVGREMEELAEMNLGSSIYGAPVVANGVLYINTRSQLYALVQQ